MINKSMAEGRGMYWENWQQPVLRTIVEGN